jgi:putative transposase
MEYRRARTEGGTYFFTVVTYKRRKIFNYAANVSLLREVFRRIMKQQPFRSDAAVLLPEHLHCIYGLVKAPKDWKYSSFHRYVRDGVYEAEWGADVDIEFETTVGSE